MQPPDDAHLTQPPPPPVQPLPMAASAATLGRPPPTHHQSLPPPSSSSSPSSPSSPSSTHPLAHQHHHPLAQSEITLPLHNRRSTPSTTTTAAAASLFRSTLTPPGSRSASPASSRVLGPRSPARSSGTFSSTTAAGGTPGSTPTMMTGSVFGGLPAALKTQSLLDNPAADNPNDPLGLMLRSFVPHVAIHTSGDVDELVADKGFAAAAGDGRGGGLWELLRPFGEHVQGKVVVRDSNGAGKAWEDFALRFVRFGEGIEEPEAVSGAGLNGQGGAAKGGKKEDAIGLVEKVVERHLKFAEETHGSGGFGGAASPPLTPFRDDDLDADATSPYYALYLRRLLSGMPLACHESFAHPVACVMAISSRNPAPIEALQKLYRETTSQGERGLPPWVDGEYLRYYVLVHDEENGDITKSMALFDQMKRNFGLHCHLLRLRSSQSAETDDDSIPLPRSDWMTAAEELADIEASDAREDFEDPTRYIFESDATAIRTFVREMVTQSLIPTMERNVSVWNDQVASRRRGISGRFMSLSKKWSFGGSSRNSTSSSSSSNYDSLGFYRADSPEAIMRRLADFAFMLRDWKLAMSTYDLLRADFQNDKAWRYHAAANEMAALALLIMPQSLSSKTRLDNITQVLEHAFYSYHIRCAALPGAARCTLLAMELLRLRGGSGIDESVRWAARVLESRLLGPVGDALLRERMAVCYASKRGAGSRAWGARRRKAALWSVLAAESWVGMGKNVQARRCVAEARGMYAGLPGECGVQRFGAASDFLAGLNERVKEGLGGVDGFGGGEDLIDVEGGGAGGVEEEVVVDVERETLGNKRRSRTASLINPVGGGAGLETAPLKDMATEGEGGEAPDDGFG